jgi:hypothetical protein
VIRRSSFFFFCWLFHCKTCFLFFCFKLMLWSCNSPVCILIPPQAVRLGWIRGLIPLPMFARSNVRTCSYQFIRYWQCWFVSAKQQGMQSIHSLGLALPLSCE